MKKSLCLLTALLMVCFVHVAFAGSGNTSFRSVNHKGYNTKAPENTLPAFERSAEMGYRYVETDISSRRTGCRFYCIIPASTSWRGIRMGASFRRKT